MSDQTCWLAKACNPLLLFFLVLFLLQVTECIRFNNVHCHAADYVTATTLIL